MYASSCTCQHRAAAAACWSVCAEATPARPMMIWSNMPEKSSPELPCQLTSSQVSKADSNQCLTASNSDKPRVCDACLGPTHPCLSQCCTKGCCLTWLSAFNTDSCCYAFRSDLKKHVGLILEQMTGQKKSLQSAELLATF